MFVSVFVSFGLYMCVRVVCVCLWWWCVLRARENRRDETQCIPGFTGSSLDPSLRQDAFMEAFFNSERSTTFSGVHVLIYVFDVDSHEHKKDVEQFRR